MFFISPALAETSANTAPSAISGFIPMILIFVVFYFLLIRPQQKKVKLHNLMINNVKKGDVVVTAGGIIGKVEKILDNGEAQILIANDVIITVMKATLANVLDTKFSTAKATATSKKKAPIKNKPSTKKTSTKDIKKTN
jgi:preprotein translocase subunit YajC